MFVPIGFCQVNVLNKAVMDDFKEVMNKLKNDGRVKAAVLSSGKLDNFIAGADIK